MRTVAEDFLQFGSSRFSGVTGNFALSPCERREHLAVLETSASHEKFQESQPAQRARHCEVLFGIPTLLALRLPVSFYRKRL
jgi:hypothetical protein